MVRMLVMLLISLMLGCNIGNPVMPPRIPAGLLRGLVVNGGPVAGATITISDGGVLVGETRSTDNGGFVVTVRAPTALLTVVATGGRYSEPAGPSHTSDRLVALIRYHQGTGRIVAVTPFTTMAATLAGVLMSRGLNPPAAAAQADGRFQQWLGVAVTRIQPLLLDSTAAMMAGWAPALRYGLAVAALSAWATNTLSSSTSATTAALDAGLADAGFLGGAGPDGPVMVGNMPLTPTTIRDGLGLAVMAVAGSPVLFHNTSAATLTGPLAAHILAWAHAVATTHVGLFDDAAPPPFGQPPLAVTLAPLPAWTHGTLMVTGTVADPFALPVTAALAIGEARAQTLSTTGAFTFAVSTPRFADGRYVLVVTATDGADETDTAHAVVGFDNSPPAACFGAYTGPFAAGVARGLWSDISGVVSGTFNGVPVTIGTGTWQADTSGTALDPLTLVLVDTAGNQSQFRWRVTQQGTTAECP